MSRRMHTSGSLVRSLCRLTLVASLFPALGQASFETLLPDGVRAVWDLDRAAHQTTPTRERICVNGLWRWQPIRQDTPTPPTNAWGFFKVPGPWPGITDYMQKDSQLVHRHPDWEQVKLGEVRAAWYEREILVPANWAGRRIRLEADCLNSLGEVFLDGKPAGEILFPGGECDLTDHCRPGTRQRLSLRVSALPLQAVLQSFTDTASARTVEGRVARRGLCGDLYLVSRPAGPALGTASIQTSFRRRGLAVAVPLTGLDPDASYRLDGRILDGTNEVHAFSSGPFTGNSFARDPLTLHERWFPGRLWNLHTPQHQFELQLTLLDQQGTTLDVGHRQRFGFRELWIAGRHFMLNGGMLQLCAVPLDNAEVGPALATYSAARESLERLQRIGINFVYTHNYGCEPGSHLAFEEILRAADDVGMLVALSQPHFSHYAWPGKEADRTNGYAQHAAYYARVAGSHPSVVFYAMSHNAAGYNQDMDPDQLDGRTAPRDTWAERNAQMAERAEAIVHGLDLSRIVYHHASGNLGAMHTVNFYPNFVPIQEQSDWFESWSHAGIKPLFTCEYAAPFTWDWTMYRGWYQGEREFGSARVPWEFCLAEWNAQFLGDAAYQISELEKANLRWEARQLREGRLWHRWDYPGQVGSDRFEQRFDVIARYLTDNWRAFRSQGVSAISPWEFAPYWRLRDGVDRSRHNYPTDWDRLQRPGFSPDYQEERFERMDLAYERDDWVPTAAARALERNNQPLLAFLGGPPAALTTKDHLFHAGDTLELNLVLINNTRSEIRASCTWQSSHDPASTHQRELPIAAGHRPACPIRYDLPTDLKPGRYEVRAQVRFDQNIVQEDVYAFRVLPRPTYPQPRALLRVFDPEGNTRRWLANRGLAFELVDASAVLQPGDTLLVGRAALSATNTAPDLSRLSEGIKVILFEQTPEALEKRFGFRIAEYGLREVFARVPNHPLLAGLDAECWRDWRGEATLQPPRLDCTYRPRHGPTVEWCGIPVTRLWRCGNRGNVASVLIEKPARGDFLPVLDGGFSLQYTPLLVHRQGRGLMVFCQLDVTARTKLDPAAEIFKANLLNFVQDWNPPPIPHPVVYAGTNTGAEHLQHAGFAPQPWAPATFGTNRILVLGAGAQNHIRQSHTTQWLRDGGRILAVGLTASELHAVLPTPPTLNPAEHIATHFDPPPAESPFAGIGPADLHNRDPRQVHLVTGDAKLLGNGVLAETHSGQVLLLQLAPWDFSREQPLNLKRTFRHLAFTFNRLASNLGASGFTPIAHRFHHPLQPDRPEQRWLEGLYLDVPEEWDDPYRFFRW